jgi:hypothetical protein
LRRPPPTAAPIPAALAPPRSAAPTKTEISPLVEASPPSLAPPKPESSPTASTASKDGGKPKARAARRGRVLTPEPEAVPEAPPALPTPVVAPAPPPVEPAQEQRPGTVALFAKGGFCYPSLDDHPARDLMPVFRNVPAGKHRVYCSRTKQSARELVGHIDLPPGGRIERTITEQDGHLTIARPR